MLRLLFLAGLDEDQGNLFGLGKHNTNYILLRHVSQFAYIIPYSRKCLAVLDGPRNPDMALPRRCMLVSMAAFQTRV